MDILAILPVRSGSKAIKDKNIISLNGIPLMGYALRTINEVKEIEHVVISSDSKKYLDIAKDYIKNPILLDRPKELALDTTPDVPVLINALEYSQKILRKNFSHILMIHATSPLLKGTHIKEALDIFRKSNADSLVSVKSSSTTPPVKIKIIKDGYLEQAIEGTIEPSTSRRQDHDKYYIRNGGFYFVSVDFLYRGRLWGDKVLPYIMNEQESIDINTEIDLKLAELLLKNK